MRPPSRTYRATRVNLRSTGTNRIMIAQNACEKKLHLVQEMMANFASVSYDLGGIISRGSHFLYRPCMNARNKDEDASSFAFLGLCQGRGF